MYTIEKNDWTTLLKNEDFYIFQIFFCLESFLHDFIVFFTFLKETGNFADLKSSFSKNFIINSFSKTLENNLTDSVFVTINSINNKTVVFTPTNYEYHLSSEFAAAYKNSNFKHCESSDDDFLQFREKLESLKNYYEELNFEQAEILLKTILFYSEIHTVNITLKLQQVNDDLFIITGKIFSKKDFINELLSFYREQMDDTERMGVEIAKRIIKGKCHGFTTSAMTKTYTFKYNAIIPIAAQILLSKCQHFIGLKLLEETFVDNNQECLICKKRFVVDTYF